MISYIKFTNHRIYGVSISLLLHIKVFLQEEILCTSKLMEYSIYQSEITDVFLVQIFRTTNSICSKLQSLCVPSKHLHTQVYFYMYIGLTNFSCKIGPPPPQLRPFLPPPPPLSLDVLMSRKILVFYFLRISVLWNLEFCC